MKLRILIAEDDPHTRAALQELLAGDGHECFAAGDGDQAFLMFDAIEPDLVCLDVMMPGKSGFELCRSFRSARADVPILFITAKSEQIDKVLGLELGGDDFIVKPFGCQEVLARIRAVARRCYPRDASERGTSVRARREGESFEMDGLLVHPKQMRAERDGNIIRLSTRELHLLELLYSHVGEVVTREMIFSVCWGYSHIPNSRTLDQMISQLRSRIERDPKTPTIIQTVYGAGYRFEVSDC